MMVMMIAVSKLTTWYVPDSVVMCINSILIAALQDWY